ncbi:MAG: signal peptidase I [Gaiellaceae bacterium]
MRRPFDTIARATTGLLAGLVIALVAGYAVLLVTGFKPVAVYSGSMRPTLGVGSLAVDRAIPARDVRVGDVITFNDPLVRGRLVTHRVVRIIPTTHGLAYRTKGDANAARDPWTIRLTGQVGRVAFHVPAAGYVLYYAHTREVRGALIAVAALLALFALLRRIWRTPQPARAEA